MNCGRSIEIKFLPGALSLSGQWRAVRYRSWSFMELHEGLAKDGIQTQYIFIYLHDIYAQGNITSIHIIHALHIFGLSCWWTRSTRSSGGNAALSRSDDGASYYYNEATDLAMGCCAFLGNIILGLEKDGIRLYYVHTYIYIQMFIIIIAVTKLHC